MAGQKTPQPSLTEEMVDKYIDCAGDTRVFHLSLYAEGRFLEAVEQRDDASAGLRFILPAKEGEIPPWGAMRSRIRRRLAQKHVVRDEKGELQLTHDVVRAQIDDSDADRKAPTLIVDDLAISWEDLGKLLLPFTGFGLRIEIHDTGEE